MTREEKQRMLLHPERYTDEQIDKMLNETDIPVPDTDTEWQKFERKAKHLRSENPNFSLFTLHFSLHKIAAMFIGVLMLSGIALMTIQFAKHDANEECVAYVYGKKTTDQETVMAEMKRLIGEIAEDNPQDNIEQQLNDLFSH